MIRTRIMLFLMIIFAAATITAHPASDVMVTFDKETSLLNVDFIHKVSDADQHFIFEVTVYLNKDEVITQAIEKQENLDGGSLVYKMIGLNPGDKIKVKTNCNKSGKKSGELTIE